MHKYESLPSRLQGFFIYFGTLPHQIFLTTSINSVINTVVENELNLCDLYLLSK